jgi:hypothetical protein
MIFGVDEIHELRLKIAEEYSKMSPEEARRDRHDRAELELRAIEEIRKAKKESAKKNAI